MDHLPMAKVAVRFICQACGTSHNRWNGKCEGCGEWNTLIEEVVERSRALVASANAPLPSLYTIDDASLVDLTKSDTQHLSGNSTECAEEVSFQDP